MEHLQNIGYFQDATGKKSSSRLNASIVIWAALLMAEQVLVFAYLMDSSIFMAATSAGSTFITIAGPAMFFMFKQKGKEADGNRAGKDQ